MYSPSVSDADIQATSDALAEAAQAAGKTFKGLKRHSRREVERAATHLADLYDHESRRMVRALAPDEQAFIDNERMVCALDFRYWCNTPDAPIWMADHSFRSLGDIHPGDEVVGWSKADRPKYAKQFVRDHYAKATVLSVARRIMPVVRVGFESGRTLTCTADHLWANGGSNRVGLTNWTDKRGYTRSYPPTLWVTATVGRTLRFAVNPVFESDLTAEQKRLSAWLGGVFDGEGSFSASRLQISQYRAANPEVHAAIGYALRELDIEYTVTDKGYYITGGHRGVHRFVALCRPVRRSKIDDALFGQVLTQKDRVVSVEPAGDSEVVSMETTTGNYVAWGYLSKNCTHYAEIVNYHKEQQHFEPNVAQNIVLQMWGDREEQGLAIWMQQLKARRLGVSTISELAVCHRFQFHRFTNAVLASADPAKTVEMAGMIKFALEQQPWWILPQSQPKIDRGIPVGYEDIQTSLTIQAGNQFTGVARGGTPNVVHLSELMEFQDAEEIIDGGLMRAVIDTPNVLGIMESTGGGVGTWWHRTWEQNKRDFARGTSRVMPVFLPWFVGTDLYPSASDRLARPVPSHWTPSDRTVQHAEKARAYVLSNPLLFKYLAKGDRDWQLSREQMYWREIEYQSAKEKKQLHIFQMELCADDDEAFQSFNIPVLDPEILIGYQERTRPPIAVYTVIGPEIPPQLVVPQRFWDSARPTITVGTRDLLARYDVKYQLIPVRFEGYSTFDEQMKLLIWEWPQTGHNYGVGVDCAEGIGLDNSAIEVLREATPMRPPGQVAELVSNQMTAFQAWPLTLAVSVLYSTMSPFAGRVTQCRIAIETASNGSAVQNELQKRGWTNFHPWKYNDRRKPLRDGEVGRLGIINNFWFRTTMMDWLMTALSEEAIDIPSRYLVQEFRALERVADERKVKAAADSNDDRVLALGFPLFSLHMNKLPSKQFVRQRVQYQPGLVDDEGIPHPIAPVPMQAQSAALTDIVHKVYRDHRGQRLTRITNRQMPEGFR